MADKTATFLRDWRRATAETIPATVVSRTAEGEYYCRLVTTNETVLCSVGNPSESYPKGTGVLLGNPSASGVTKGYGLVILRRAATSWRNLSTTPADTDTRSWSGISVASVSPNPIELNAGDSVAVTIKGKGFTALPTFSSAFLTASGATITDTQITFTLTASPLTLNGRYTMSLGGRDWYVSVKQVNTRLWIGGAQLGVDQNLYRINHLTGAIDLTLAMGADVYAICGSTSTIYVLISGPALKVVSRTTGAVTKTVTLTHSAAGPGAGQAVWDGTWVWYTGNDGLCRVNPTSEAQEQPISGEACTGLTWDGTYVWTVKYTTQKLSKVASDGTVTEVAATTGIAGGGILFDGTDLYVIRVAATPNGTVNKYSTAGALLVSQNGFDSPFSVAALGDHIYISHKSNTNPGEVVKVLKSDLSTVATVAAGNKPRGMATDGARIWTVCINDAWTAGKSQALPFSTALVADTAITVGTNVTLSNSIVFV